MENNGTTTSNTSDVGSITWRDALSNKSKIESDIQGLEEENEQLQMSIKIANQEIKSNKAMIKILKEFLNK